MFFFTRFSEGQHVIARCDIEGWLGPLGFPAVKKGCRGIIRAGPTGWFTDRYEVEFYRSGTVSATGEQLRAAMFGHGPASWRKYQQTRQGIALGMFLLFGLPTAYALVRHYLAGGSTADIVAALPVAVIDVIADLVALIGLPLVLVLAGCLWIRAKLRSR